MPDDTMPQPETGIYRRSDSTQWQWRIKAPKELRAFYASQWAYGCSLQTSDLREANRKAAQLRAQWLNRFEEQRRELNPQKVERLTPQLARLIAEKALHDTLDREDVRIDPSWRSSMLTWHRGMGLVGMQTYAQGLGVVFDENTPGAKEGLLHYLQALEKTLKARLAEQPPAPAEKAADQLKPRVLRDVFNKWKASRDGSSDGVKACERALKLYEEHTGNPPLNKLTRAQGDDFRTWLQTLGTASKTAHDRLTYIKSLLGYAYQDLEWLERNPWKGLEIDHTTENGRQSWTDEQVQAFFNLPLFQRYELPKLKHAAADAAYWIPLLGLYTGARISELCQLRVVDVVTKNGQAFISINDEGEGASVKTAAGVRDIPIHSELIRLGFLEYAEATKKTGHELLWPAIKVREGKAGFFFSRWFNQVARKLVTDCEIPDFHSFRHTVRTKMAEAEFDEAIQDRITGHKLKGSVGTRVYSHPTKVLGKAVEAITYPGLVLPKVYQQTASL